MGSVKPEGREPSKKNADTEAMSGAARSSFEEGRFGMNSGSGPNASRNVARTGASNKQEGNR